MDRESGPASVDRAIQENKSLKKRVRELLEIALREEAGRLLDQSPIVSATATSGGGAAPAPFRLVRAVFPDRDLEELRMLAWKIIEKGPSAALLGTNDGSSARLIFARSADLPFNMGAILAKACEALGGRGGGKPDMAQGGGPNVENLQASIQEAADTLAAK